MKVSLAVPLDRRLRERRVDRKRSVALARAFAMLRAFGRGPALAMLLRAGFDSETARAFVAGRADRRIRTGRR